MCIDVWPAEEWPERPLLELLDAGLGRARASAQRAVSELPPGSLSCVYAHHVLEHLPSGEQAATVRGLAGLLREGGVLYLCQPDLDAVSARILEEAQPGAAEAWFAADPESRSIPGEVKGRRAGLRPGEDPTDARRAWTWLYCGGCHLSVPSERDLLLALEGTGVELRRARRRLADVRPDLRLFVSLEGRYVGVRR